MIRKLLSVQATLMSRDRSAWIIAVALMIWGVSEGLLGNYELSFAANFIPIVAAWIAAWGIRDDLVSGGLDLVLSRGVPLPTLILSRALIATAFGIVLLALMTIPLYLHPPYAAIPGALGTVVGLAVGVFYWSVVGAIAGPRLSAAGVVLLGLAGTFLSLSWIYSVCPRITGQVATEWPWILVTWVLQITADYFPADQLGILRAGNLWPWMELSRAVLTSILLAVGVRSTNRLSLPAGV